MFSRNQILKGLTVLALLPLIIVSLIACTGRGGEAEIPANISEAPNPLPSPTLAEIQISMTATPAHMEAVLSSTVPRQVSVEDLNKASYYGILDHPVTLTCGRFEGDPFVEGGATRPVVNLMPEPIAYGDVNDDGQGDAAVILVADMGGSGSFVYLAVVGAEAGETVNPATTLLGDRVQVQSVSIEDGQIVVRLLTQGPDDPACCPTLDTIRGFSLQDNQLVESAPANNG
jgi:hypothetical protein